MKKLLALVLALVMTLSLCTISNAAFTDAKDVDASYEEAVAVLNGMGVFKGYEDGSFKPEGSITRAEVAAIVYRLYTGDVKDKQAGLYAGYGKFDDMAGATWAAGYVGFCANAGFVKGYGNGKFGPSDPVTGYQALAMILRAVGYGKNGEFEGADWELHVAQIAQQLKVLKNVKGVSLKAAASRELVAELLFQVAAYVDTVEYTPAFGYVANTVVTAKAETLGEKNFNLTKSADGADNWGRPQYKWFSDDNGNKTVDAKETKYATIQAKPVATYTTAVTECQVAADYGFEGTKTLTTYVNGAVNKVNTVMQATDTVGKIGAQGRLTEVYGDRIVMIDTYLAQVTKVTPARYDAAGHEITPASTTLLVYDGTTETGATVAGNQYTIAGNDFAKGDYILLNAVTNAWNSKTLNEGAADKYYETKGVAPSFVGAQTTIWNASNQHIIGGTTYDDAYNYILDAAYRTVGTNFTWFQDLYGNVIGSAAIVNPYSYAILKDLYWNTGRPGYATATLRYVDGTEKTDVVVSSIQGVDNNNTNSFANNASGVTWGTFTPMATDGNASTVRFNDPYAYVSDEGRFNGMYEGYALYAVETNANGSVKLIGTNWLHANDAKVVTGGTEITKSTTGIGDRVYVDNATIFVVRSGNALVGYTYTNYVGKDNVPTFVDDTSASARKSDGVFYVDVNDDRVADYVYIQDGIVDSASTALVTARGEQWAPYVLNGVNVYGLRYAQVNGVDVAEGTVLSDTSSDITTMASNVNQLYKVVYLANGKIDTIAAVTTSGVEIGPNTAYKMMGQIYTVGQGTLVTDSSNVGGVTSWNVSNVPVYGDYTDLKDVVDFSKTYTYIVVDTSTKAVAKAVYVYNIPDTANGSGTSPVVNFDVTGATLAKTGANTVKVALAGTGNIPATYGLEIELYHVDAVNGNAVADTQTYTYSSEGGVVGSYLNLTFPSAGNYYAVVTVTNASGVVVDTVTSATVYLA